MRKKVRRLTNISYIFIPFYYSLTTDLLSQKVEESDHWVQQSNTYKYFLKYIVEKFRSDSPDYCIQQFLLNDINRKDLGIISSEISCYMRAKKSNESGHPFSFKIKGITLYTFDTNIGIIEFKILHPSQDSYSRIATKCYHLKKVYTAKLYIDGNEGLVKNQNVDNLFALAEYIVDNIGISSEDRQIFFNYSDPNEYRSNILTHYGLVLDEPISDAHLEEIRKILFYLRRNYYSQWTYDKGQDDKEANYSPSKYIHWGITSEGTACVTVIDSQVNFVTNSFFKNFQSYYLIMYVLCLHQKFSLYNYLSMLGRDLQDNPTEINAYITYLAELRAKYMFGIISESETYQTVYKKTRQAFGLNALFSDVEDQARRITEIQNAIAERKQEKRDDKINTLGTFLSFFCVFSTIVDIQELIAKLDWLLGANGVKTAQQIGSITILLIGIVLIVVFIKSLKR